VVIKLQRLSNVELKLRRLSSFVLNSWTLALICGFGEFAVRYITVRRKLVVLKRDLGIRGPFPGVEAVGA